jgi:hypothetical protein
MSFLGSDAHHVLLHAVQVLAGGDLVVRLVGVLGPHRHVVDEEDERRVRQAGLLAFSAMSMNSSNAQASSLAPPRWRFRSWSSFRWTLDCLFVVQELMSAGGKTVWGDSADVTAAVGGASFDVVLDNNGKDLDAVKYA